MGSYSKTEYLVRFAIFFGYSYWLFRLFVTDALNYYVHSRFHNLSLVTAGVMLLLALTQLAGYFSDNGISLKQNHAGGCCGTIDHLNANNRRVVIKKIFTYFVFLVPLCLGMIFTGGLDPALAEKKGFEVDVGRLQETVDGSEGLIIENNFLAVENHNYTLFKDQLWGKPQDLIGVEVTALGFLYQPAWLELPKEQFILGRYVITCCAADALVGGFLIFFPEEFTAVEFDWVQIRGKIIYTNYQDEEVGAVIVEKYEVVEQPLDPYLFY